MPVLLDDAQSRVPTWRLNPALMAERLTRGQRGHFVVAPHVLLVAHALAEIASGRLKRLIIVMPPRHGKSETVSHWFPVWLLDLFPHWRIMLASYEATFASEWGWKVRESIKAHEDNLRVRLSEDFAARSAWYTAVGGAMFTAGVGGPFTGRGGNVLILDDLFKNYEQAFSAVIREKVWNWYLSTAFTRLEPGGAQVAMFTRWHEDDLIGRLIAHGEETGEPWLVLRLPALAEDDDLLGRAPGEALWPQRYPAARLQSIRRTLGPYLWEAMYQQNPSPPEGAIFRKSWWRFYHEMPSPLSFDEVIQSWDMAFKGMDDSDFVVGQVWGRIGADRFLLDQIRERLDFVGTVKAFRNLSAKWPQATVKLVEDKANGPAVISTLRNEIPGILAWPAEGSKESRAYATTGVVEAGNVWLPDTSLAPWVHDFVEELGRFPTGTNDDQVDAFTQAMLRWQGNAMATVTGYRDARLRGRR